MLRRSVVLFAIWCAAGAALAQSPAPPAPAAWQGRTGVAWMRERRMMQQRRMERLTVLLDLTPAQQRRVATIMRAERARMKPSLERLRRSMRAVRAARGVARRDAMRQFASALTPAQMRKLKLLMPKQRRFMMRGGMGMHMGMGMMMMGPCPMMPPGPPGPPPVARPQ
jgi:Spy/CpxP family protein refolding chaperone